MFLIATEIRPPGVRPLAVDLSLKRKNSVHPGLKADHSHTSDIVFIASVRIPPPKYYPKNIRKRNVVAVPFFEFFKESLNG